MSNGEFATAINCMDGRTQLPVFEYLKDNFAVDFVDMITEPGPNKILADDKDKTLVNSIRRRVEISVNKHQSKIIAVVGHYDCAGNPADKDEQEKQISIAINRIKQWNLGVELIGLWVDQSLSAAKV